MNTHKTKLAFGGVIAFGVGFWVNQVTKHRNSDMNFHANTPPLEQITQEVLGNNKLDSNKQLSLTFKRGPDFYAAFYKDELGQLDGILDSFHTDNPNIEMSELLRRNPLYLSSG